MVPAEWKRIVSEAEKAIQKAVASYKEHNERSKKVHDTTIGAPLSSLTEQFERYTKQQHLNDEGRRCREIATIIGLAVTACLTFVTAIIFYFQLNQMRIGIRHADEAAGTQHVDTLTAIRNAEAANAQQARATDTALALSKETLIAANRAWIVPLGVDAQGEITDDKDIAVKIQYSNVGKSPAIKWNEHFSAHFIYTPINSETIPVVVGNNIDCDDLLLNNSGIAVFQNGPKDEWANTIIPRSAIVPHVPLLQANHEALIITGCFVYETMNEPHRTWFCYVVYRNGRFVNINATTQCAGSRR